MYDPVDEDGTLDAMFATDDGVWLYADDVNGLLLRGREMRRWRVGVQLDLWLRQVVVIRRKVFHSVCKRSFYTHDGHNHICNAVATIFYGQLLLLTMCVCGLLSVLKALMLSHGRQMGSSRLFTGR